MNKYTDKCAGCSCVLNYNQDSEFCGKLGRIKGKITTLGCDVSCPQCKSCNYKNKNQSSTTRNSTKKLKSLSTYLNNSYGDNPGSPSDGILSKREFLQELRKQQLMNNKEMGFINNLKNNQNNQNNQNNNVINNINFKSYEELDKEELQKCIDLNEDNCDIDKGCGWNRLSDLCEKLEVVLYTEDKMQGDSFKLPVGNYDLSDIDNFDFLPKFISIPKGLRAKIYYKSGFVGEYDLFIGNYKLNDLEDKNLYQIDKLGSLQICDMITCGKPSNLGNLKLINIISNDNIDSINDEKVNNIEDYRNVLKNNIKNRINYIIRTKKDCINNVLEYLKINGIKVDKNFDNENDINELHKIKYLLNNIPDCTELIKYDDYTENKTNEELKNKCGQYFRELEEKVENNNNYEAREELNELKSYLSPSYNTSFLAHNNYNNIPEPIEEPSFFEFNKNFFQIILIVIIIILLLGIFFVIYNYNNSTTQSILKNNINNNINNFKNNLNNNIN